MMETNSEKSLPVGAEDFADVIDNDMVYVDKTDLVAELARELSAFFLSRPRRFGKSLLLTTFKELFLHGKEKFKGLKLEEKKPWTDHTYKVIHLNLSFFSDKSSLSAEDVFVNRLKTAFTEAGFSFNVTVDWQDTLDLFLAGSENRSLVLLIDEYDKPLVHVLDNADEFERRRSFFSDFYAIIKKRTDKFRFIFITGVTRITNIGLFSGPNNVRDISFASRYGAITGFTQEELEQKFKPYIANAAEVLNEEEPQEYWDEQKVLEGLKAHYDGYSFEPKMKHRVYNPWSVINFLAQPEDNFYTYWLDSSNSALPAKFLNSLAASPVDLTEMLDFLGNVPKPCSRKYLSPVISHLGQKNFPLIAVLYQAGYLTIKKAYEDLLYIGIPNNEVRTAFSDAVISRLMDIDEDEVSELKDQYLQSIIEAFATKNLPAMKAVMNSIINGFSYEVVKDFKERAFSEVLGNFIRSLTKFTYEGIQERRSALGRADMHLRCGKYRYIFELKVADDRDKADEAFERGKDQLLDRKYANLLEPLIIVPGVIVIVNEKKRDEKRNPSLIREIVRMEELPLTDEQLANLTGRSLN